MLFGSWLVAPQSAMAQTKQSASSNAENLITNGDFEQGNVYFNSDLKNSDDLFSEGNYAITGNPKENHRYASAYGDNTSGKGLMMAVNGSPVHGQVVWKQDGITVRLNTQYDFGAYLSSWTPENPARLVFSINGQTIGTLDASATQGKWNHFFANWHSGSATAANIAIINENTVKQGNDFALDDIYFGAPVYTELAQSDPKSNISSPNTDPIAQGSGVGSVGQPARVPSAGKNGEPGSRSCAETLQQISSQDGGAVQATNNLISNGDFEQGNRSFLTDFNYSQDLIPEGNYFITENPKTNHSSSAAFGDHTTGSGKMMAINGAPEKNQVVWKQDNISVNANTQYDFAAYLSSWTPANPADLVFSINGNEIGRLEAAKVAGKWNGFFATWDSGSARTADISILNKNTVASGNDFALDDLYFGAPVFSESAGQSTSSCVQRGEKKVVAYECANNMGDIPFTLTYTLDSSGEAIGRTPEREEHLSYATVGQYVILFGDGWSNIIDTENGTMGYVSGDARDWDVASIESKATFHSAEEASCKAAEAAFSEENVGSRESASSRLIYNEAVTFRRGDSDGDGTHRLMLQEDGDFVVQTLSGVPVYRFSDFMGSEKYGRIAEVRFQADGNFAAYDAEGGYIWSAMHKVNTGGTLELQPDGNLLLINSSGGTEWAFSWKK